MEVITSLGILSPRILQKINSARNELEHEFKKPSREFVETSLDVALLFSKYVERYWKHFRVGVVIEFDDMEEWFRIEMDPNSDRVLIEHYRMLDIMPYQGEKLNSFHILYSGKRYLDFLKLYLEVYEEW